nr:hypothetical protein [Oscillospiraceae bacterium]
MGIFLTKKERQQKVEKATGFLEWATTEKEIAYAKYQDYISSTAALDFMTYDSDEVRRKGEELEEKYKSAALRVENARKELWSAKYDTMSAQQLQAAMAEAEEDEEKAYIKDIQNTQVAEQRERDLKIMLQRGDPESVLYGAQAYLSTIGDDINTVFAKPDTYIPMTAAEMTVQQIYNDLADVGGTFKINGKPGDPAKRYVCQ